MIKEYSPDIYNVITGDEDDEQIVWTDSWYRNITVYAKSGNDLIDFRNSVYNNSLYGNNGNDTIYGGFASDTLFGGKNNDSIYGYKGSDFLYGNKGHDTIYGGKGNDYVDGGSGNDFLYGDVGNDKLYGGTGNDTIYGYKNNDLINGDEGNDKLYGGNGKDTIYAGIGNDLIYGNNGNDKVYGGKGNDSIYGGNGADLIKGDAGNDKLYGDDDADTIYGGKGKDIIKGGNGNDKIYGGSDDDTIYGGAGKDTIYADAGNDIIYGDSGIDDIYISDGNNTVYGGSGNDKIYIDGGSNHIYGDSGNDKIYISSGKSTLHFKAGDGNDIITNSSSVTTFDFNNSELKFENENSDLIIYYGNDDSVKIQNYTSNADKYFIKTKNSKISVDDYKNSLAKGDSGITLYLEKNKQQTVILRDSFDSVEYKYTFSSNSSNSNVYVEYLDNGRLYIKGKHFNLTANSGQKDNLIILGSNNNIDTGDKDDIVRTGYILDSDGYYDYQSNYNTINTGSGNDYVTFYGFRNNINTGSGNDYVYAVSSSINMNSQNITNAESINKAEQNTSKADGKVGNFYQGYAGGDCRFLALIQSLSQTSNFKLSDYISVTTNANNTYTVTYNKYKSGQNSVNISSAELQNDLCVYGDLDVVLADVAINKLISINKDAGNTSIFNADYNTISDYIFGTKSTTYIHPSYNYNYEDKFAELWNSYKAGKINNFTVGIFAGEDLSLGIVEEHAYAVKEYTDEYITLINVWDTLDYLQLDTDDFFNLSTGVFVYGNDYYKSSQYIVQESSPNGNSSSYNYDIDNIQNEITSWNISSISDDVEISEIIDKYEKLPEITAVQNNNFLN